MSHVLLSGSDKRQQSAHTSWLSVESRSFFTSNSLQSASTFPDFTSLLYADISEGRKRLASSHSVSDQKSAGLRFFINLFRVFRKSIKSEYPSHPFMDSTSPDTRSVSASSNAVRFLPVTGISWPSAFISNYRFRTLDRSNSLHSMKNLDPVFRSSTTTSEKSSSLEPSSSESC